MDGHFYIYCISIIPFPFDDMASSFKVAIIIFKLISFSAKNLLSTPYFSKFGNKIIKKAFSKFLTESQSLLLCEGGLH